MYLFGRLDRFILSSVMTAGLEKMLRVKGIQYNIIVGVRLVLYGLTAPLLAIARMKFGPNRVLA